MSEIPGMPETQEETMHPKDVKGAQPEQLVEEARRCYENALHLDRPRELCLELATALSECREREQKVQEALNDPIVRLDALGLSGPAEDGWLIYRESVLRLALAAQSPSEASERSGT